ncbi:SDR family NAD(P)-dependent oxidoreductase [Alienimonas chondri]|nr:SDR family oxidoreductase [Alienimonas chondri]
MTEGSPHPGTNPGPRANPGSSAPRPLAGQRALVTGAGRGIGAAIAVALARGGADVAINDLEAGDEARGVAERCREFGGRVRLAPADVGDRDAIDRIVAETAEEFGGLEIAVSNAAYSDRERFHEADMDGFERTIRVTMWGAFHLLRASTRRMIADRTAGSIVFVSSPHSWEPIPGAMAYNMAKAAVDQMARTAATELCEHRIRVNLVHPGWIDTPGERKFFHEDKLSALGSELPWGRLGKPEEIARGVLFLCDPASEYMTGSSLLIDGGIGLPVREMHRLDTPSRERPGETSPDARVE